MERDEANELLIERLEKRRFRHYTERSEIFKKNKLYADEISVELVIRIINDCVEEKDYKYQEFTEADDNKFHIFIKYGWYIKFYLRGGVVYIYSVHKDEKHAGIPRG